MRTIICPLAIALLLLKSASISAAGGYVNRPFLVGENLFANPLQWTNSMLSEVFLFSTVPIGTTVSLWNPLTASYGATSVFGANGWSLDFALPPGTGALLTAPLEFTATFIGAVEYRDGTPFTGPAGVYLLGDKLPVNATGTDIFMNVLGRVPSIGEQITLLDENSQIYTTSTYLGGGAWDIVPSWNVSDAAFFQVVPEPAPLLLGLTALGLVILWPRRRS